MRMLLTGLGVLTTITTCDATLNPMFVATATALVALSILMLVPNKPVKD